MMAPSLTSEQRQVVEHAGSHCLVAAVAGSGKSETLVERILFLLGSGVASGSILVLMFNKPARDEFDRRLQERLPAANAPEVCTFHAFGKRLCDAMVQHGLLPPARLFANDAECLDFARSVLAMEHGADLDEDSADLSVDALFSCLDVIDVLKGALYDGGAPPARLPDSGRRFVKTFARFEERRRELRIRMFSDLIADPVQAALAHPAAAAFLADRYDHILVDEFQDINEAQMTMVELLAGTRARVLAVGDDDQTIYGWRGARPDYMTRLFSERFPGTAHYSLTQTFRFGHSLALMANHVIVNNRSRLDKVSLSAAGHGTIPRVRLHRDDVGLPVVQELSRWVAGGGSLREAAILVRQYSHAMPIELALCLANVPYRILGAPSIRERPEYIAVLGYLHLAARRFAELRARGRAFDVLIGMLGMPNVFLPVQEQERLASLMVQRPEHLSLIFEKHIRDLRKTAPFLQEKRLEIVRDWHWCSNQTASASAGRFLDELYRRMRFVDQFVRARSRSEFTQDKCSLLQQLSALAYKGGHSIGSFLDLLASFGGCDAGEGPDSVLLTSVHRSKGLEWNMVIMPDLAEGQFPGGGLKETEEEIEDERRLFYVGLTRARREIVLVAPFDQQLIAWSEAGRTGHPPTHGLFASRFLYEANIQTSLRAGHWLEGNERVDSPPSAETERYLRLMGMA